MAILAYMIKVLPFNCFSGKEKKKMKITISLVVTVILVLGMAFSCPALTITDQNYEVNLYKIVNSWLGTNFISSQSMVTASGVTIYETLGAGSYEITDYATYALSTQTFGWYADPGIGNSKNQLLFGDPDGTYTLGAPIVFAPASGFGFYDTPSGSGTKYTEYALNPGYPGSGQSNGLILKILSPLDSQYHYIIFFEALNMGDRDYNDLVLNAKANAVPEPCTVLLVSSGFIGLAGFRRKFRSS